LETLRAMRTTEWRC